MDKAPFDREQAKLFLTNLFGRNNMSLDLPHTIVTKSVNDVVALLGDGVRYHNVKYDSFIIDEVEWYRVSFTDVKYDENIQQFNVVSYLSAYMLGYSKMLMQACFQYID